MKMVTKGQLKIVIFTAVKNRCILHGRVVVMSTPGAYNYLESLQNVYGLRF